MYLHCSVISWEVSRGFHYGFHREFYDEFMGFTMNFWVSQGMFSTTLIGFIMENGFHD